VAAIKALQNIGIQPALRAAQHHRRHRISPDAPGRRLHNLRELLRVPSLLLTGRAYDDSFSKAKV
jgi:hypothetical protein